MVTHQLVQRLVDNIVLFATDLLLPVMALAFIFCLTLRLLIYYTIKREDWFTKEFSKRVRKFMEARDDKASQSFFVISKRLLEITYYEVFEIRSILKRRNPDVIMTLADRIFLIQQGSARLIYDILSQIKYFKWGERPKFLELSNNVLRSNPCFGRVFGIIPIAPFNDFLNLMPGLFVVGGIFGTFMGIMKALPALGGMDLANADATKLIMDDFLLKLSFSMSTSIVGIMFSVISNVFNTFFSCEKIYISTVERLENELDILWNMSVSNKLPNEIINFDADRDPIEVLSESLISKELNVEAGFLNIVWPVSKWWNRMGKASPGNTGELPGQGGQHDQSDQSDQDENSSNKKAS